jgi:hypothetical protein
MNEIDSGKGGAKIPVPVSAGSLRALFAVVASRFTAQSQPGSRISGRVIRSLSCGSARWSRAPIHGHRKTAERETHYNIINFGSAGVQTQCPVSSNQGNHPTR